MTLSPVWPPLVKGKVETVGSALVGAKGVSDVWLQSYTVLGGGYNYDSTSIGRSFDVR